MVSGSRSRTNRCQSSNRRSLYPSSCCSTFYKNGANRPSPQNNSINTPLAPFVPTGKTQSSWLEFWNNMAGLTESPRANATGVNGRSFEKIPSFTPRWQGSRIFRKYSGRLFLIGRISETPSPNIFPSQNNPEYVLAIFSAGSAAPILARSGRLPQLAEQFDCAGIMLGSERGHSACGEGCDGFEQVAQLPG